MTRFAPPILYQCPACADYFKRSGFRSLHFDDEIPDWSDGRNGNWWARESGSVGRCPSCSGIVWIDDAEKLMPAPQEPRPIGPISRVWHLVIGDRNGRLREEREWKVLPAGVQQAEYFDGLVHAHDFIEALTSFSSDAQDRETYLRRRIWWASSDHLRGQRGVSLIALPSVAEDVAHANMQRLLELFEHDPKEQVARGELLRRLGRFDEAVAVLKAVKPDGHSEIKAIKIGRLAAAGIADVRDLNAAPTLLVSTEGASPFINTGGVAW
jgi:hypothetical protein